MSTPIPVGMTRIECQFAVQSAAQEVGVRDLPTLAPAELALRGDQPRAIVSGVIRAQANFHAVKVRHAGASSVIAILQSQFEFDWHSRHQIEPDGLGTSPLAAVMELGAIQYTLDSFAG